jgi:hypothetical protein
MLAMHVQYTTIEQLHISLTRPNENHNEKSAYAGGVVLLPSNSSRNQ